MWQNLFILVYGLHVYPVCPIIDPYHMPLIVVLKFIVWNIFWYWFNWHRICTVCSTTETHKNASSQLDLHPQLSYMLCILALQNQRPSVNRTRLLLLLQPFYDPLSGTTQVSRYQKDRPFWNLLKQIWWGGSGISWTISKLFALCSRR